MIVTRPEIARLIEEVARRTPDPAQGLYGPDSVTWRIAGESVVFLGAGRAALLQLAHPYVAHAIAQHSATMRDPIGRFNRTFQALYAMIFGDLDTAVDAALRVRAIHDRVHGPIDEDVGRYPRGHRYHANDRGALLWVHATLVETAVMTFEMAYGPLPTSDKEAYYQELKRNGALFGLGEADFPPSWADFTAYCQDTVASDAIAVGAPARQIAGFLMAPSSPAMRPVMRWYAAFTAGLLPPKIRDGFGLAFGPAEARAHRWSLKAVRGGWPLIPARLRKRPEHVEALRRLAGRPREDWIGRTLERAVLFALRPKTA